MEKWLSITSLIILLCSCSGKTEVENNPSVVIDDVHFAWQINAQEIKGNTQGSTFSIKTSDDSLLTSVAEIEELLSGFDSELSGYIPNSLLSQLNAAKDEFIIPANKYFDSCYALSQTVYNKTNGAFDPSVFPLVKAWGFFKDSALILSQKEVDSCLSFISFEKNKHHSIEDGKFIKKDNRFKIDFNAIAQGYSVDVLANFLELNGQQNYLVEIGGEVRVKGVNAEGKPWVLGIDQPSELNTGIGSRALENTIHISSGGLATSGNYRKFHTVNGRKYSHTLNPKTGYSVKHTLLSATVYTNNCAFADAYATAFMVMGKDATLKFLADNPSLNLEVYLLFQNEDGRIERAYSKGMFDHIGN